MTIKWLPIFLVYVFLAACRPVPTAFPTPTPVPTITPAITREPTQASTIVANIPLSTNTPSATPSATITRTSTPTGTPTATPPPPAVTAAPNAIKIQFWHSFSEPSQAIALQRFADKFNAAHPAYYIQPIFQPSILGTLRANASPDLVLADPSDLIAVSNLLSPLDSYINDPKEGFAADLIADITPANLFFDKWESKTLGISPGRSGIVVFYNIDMLKTAGFNNPPSTWDEFDKICAAVTKGDQYCFPATASSLDTSTFASMVFSRGGTYASPDEKKAMFDDTAGVDTLKWLKNMAATGYGKISGITLRNDQTEFGNGQVAFAFGSTASLPLFQDAVNGRKEGSFQWSVAPIPAGTKGKQVFNIVGPSFGVFKTTPEKQRGAFLFIKFMLQKENQIEWAQRLVSIPASKSARDALGAMNAQTANALNPRFGLVVTQLKKTLGFLPWGIREPLNPAWRDVRSTITNMLTVVFTGKSSADFTATDPESAAKEGVQRVNKILDLYSR